MVNLYFLQINILKKMKKMTEIYFYLDGKCKYCISIYILYITAEIRETFINGILWTCS